ncbi:MAG TPA: class D sortase [Vicinamibacterales bacterium]|nr:class D sortase [Vicinamibacterales bacterium]
MHGRWKSLVWLEYTLFALGVVCLGYYGYMSVEARQFQREEAAKFEALLERPPAPAPAPAPSDAAREVTEAGGGEISPEWPSAREGGPAVPGTLALLDIPRLNLSAPVLSGDDAATLDLAVGHLPDTPLPWEPGNSALAAHRDGLFRPLRDIRVGDDVRVRTEHGEFAYRVRETKIVMPDDLSVLAATDADTLTLITCYPFNFVGNAPKRFIVHAERQ